MQITLDELNQAVADLEKYNYKSMQIAVFYIKKELKRRKNSGRPSTSELTRKEQIRKAVSKHRAKHKSE